MNKDISTNKITSRELKNQATKKLLEPYIKDPSRLDNEDLYTKLTKDLQSIQADNDIEIIKPISEHMDEALKPIETYKLNDDSPFKILDNQDTMLLRNGLITIGAEANTGKTSLATHLAIELMKANENTCFIFFSLDDSRTLGIKRILSQIGKKAI